MSAAPVPVPRPTRRLTLRRVTALVLALAAVGLVRWFRQPVRTPVPADGAARGTVVLSDAAWRDAGLTVETVQTVRWTRHFEAPGTLTLDETQTARIGSMVDGKVVRVSAEVGDRVQRQQVLAELHSPIVHEVWAAYRKAIAERKRARTELTYANRVLDRAQRLFADKAVSQQEVQRAQVDRVAAEQAVDMANTEVRRSEEALEHLGVTSGEDPSGEAGEEIPVRTPISGSVLERSVTAGSGVTTGMPLFVVSDLSTLWALAEVDETTFPRLRVGRPVAVRVAAYPGDSFAGEIVFIGDTLDPRTRRVSVRSRVPNADGRLKPQMYATIVMDEGDPRDVLAVPATAVQEIDGKPVVFVAGAGGACTRRDIGLGQEANGLVEVTSGLQTGERIVATGSFLLKSELLKAAAVGED